MPERTSRSKAAGRTSARRRAITGRPDRIPDLPDEALAALSRRERIALRLVLSMNRPASVRVWGWWQRHVGARAVGLAVAKRLRVHGLEHVDAASRERPLLLVANHRSYFDLFVVAHVILRRTRGWREIHFPVRARYFYQSVGGVLINALASGWAMFPPFFTRPDTRAADDWGLRALIALCSAGRGRLVGFHPEGRRNKSDDPYHLLPAQPGIGRLIHVAAPQVIPVFVAGLDNHLSAQLRAEWRGGAPVRIHFGEALRLDAQLARPARARTYVEIAGVVMRAIADLGEADRALYAGS